MEKRRTRLRRRGDLVEAMTGEPGRPAREPVVLVRLLQEGQFEGRERWLARAEDGETVFVLVSPTAEEPR